MWYGRGALCDGRSGTGRSRGRNTSENAGMSSENCVRNVMAENLRFPGVGSSAPGKPGAKARPKGVVDAQTVENPLPYALKYTDTNVESNPGAGSPGRKGLKFK